MSKMVVGGAEERRVLDEFRKLVKDLEQDEATLTRFLRARNHDLIKAEDMLRKAVEWRQTNKVDDALNWKMDEKLVSQFPLEYPGVDLKNRAVFYIPVGAWHIREMIEKGHKEEMLQYIYVCLERLMEEVKKSGEQFTMIVDLDELSYWKLAHMETVQITLKVFRDFEANYPERLGEALIINAPLVLNYIYPMIKPLLSGQTLSKVKFLGGNGSKYMPAVLERVPFTSLPGKLREVTKKYKVSIPSTHPTISEVVKAA